MSILNVDGSLFKTCLISGANNLINHKKEVDDLNVFPVPDGDTGTNMSMTIGSASADLFSKDSNDLSEMAGFAASASLRGARGNSGVILSQLLRGFYRGLDGAENADVNMLANALVNAKTVAYKAVMKPTEGTILTVARESAEYAAEIAAEETDVIEFLEKVLVRAKESLDNTPNILPVLKQAGVVDAGGMGVVVILEGVLSALKGEPVEISEEANVPQQKTTVKRTEIDTANIKFMYCTEFIINVKFELQPEPETAKVETTESTTDSDIDFTKKKLLLVDDIEVNREIAVMILMQAGFTVDTASNGQEALEKVAASNPGDYDAVLMDIQMPVMNGYESSQAIRKLSNHQLANIPIIAMTANAFSEDIQAAKDAGMNDHISKPIDVNKMMETLKKILS